MVEMARFEAGTDEYAQKTGSIRQALQALIEQALSLIHISPGRKMQASPFLPDEEPEDPPPLPFRASMEPAGGELGPCLLYTSRCV